MTYEETDKAKVSRKAAQLEIKKHGLLWSDFVIDEGEKDIYNARTILDWLGY